jgi:UTP--glucose-1-phosphate uridylyltransferase
LSSFQAQNHTKIRKAVFPAAGLGTRFLPATKAQPKEMLPLVDKPIIQYVIEEAVASGIQNIIIVTGRGKNAIEDHFDVSYELEKILESRGKKDLLQQVRAVSELIHVSYVRQKEALGLGHAILMTRELVGDEPFAVFLGDDIIESKTACMKQMMEVYDRVHSAVVALEEVPREDTSRYGIIDGTPLDREPGNRIFKIKNMVEKPAQETAPSNLAIIGRYILPPEIFDCLEKTQAGAGGEIQLTDGLKALLSRQPIYGYKFEGKRHDAGDKLGFLKATVEFALKRPDLGGPFREYLKSLKL